MVLLHFLEFCMGINDQREALMTSVNIFLNSNDFNSMSMKDRWLFILTEVRYNEIAKKQIAKFENFNNIYDNL